MGEIKDQLGQVDERDMDRVVAIIKGMTPAERKDPKIIDGSRRKRIANGSGVDVSEVNGLVDRFFEARKMMMSMAGGGGMPGMPGIGGGMGGRGTKKGKGKAKAPVKTKGRSGNPAARARQVEEAELRRASGTALPELPKDFELPPELRDLMPPGGR